LVIGGAALGYLLREIDGGPRTPDWPHIREVLAGSEIADADVIAGTATFAWLVLGYLAITVGVRLLLLLADRISRGAGWAQTGLQLSNLITIPAVRRVVDGGMAGTLLVLSWLPHSTRIGAAAAPVAVVALAPPPLAAWEAGPQWSPELAPQEESPQFIEYTVVRGDDLWDIARRFYGDGSRFVEIFETNRDRVMPGGERFTDPRLIWAGWTLQIPLPATNVSARDGVVSYRVRRGEHLWGIAERFLGDGFRWVEIWARNGGREMSAGRRFTDPNLIYPGWLLELPIEIARTDAPAFPIAGSEPVEPLTPTATAPPLEPTVAPVAPTETPAPSTELGSDGGWSWEWPTLPRPVIVTAAGFAVIGGTAVFIQRIVRSGRLRVPGSGRAPHGGPGDAGRVTLATRSLTRALADYGFGDSHALLVQEAGRRLAFTVQCPVGDAEALAGHRHDLERRLACEVEVDVIGTTRIVVTLSGFQRLAGLLADEFERAAPALIVPVGADDAGIVYLNVAAAGTVAVGGSEGERRQLLRSWLATLATTHAPQELALRVDAATARQLGDEAALPHAGGVQPAATDELVAELEELVESRAIKSDGRAALAVVAPESGQDGVLAALLRDGAPVGVFVVRAMAAEDVLAVRGADGATVLFRPDQGADDEEDEGESGAIALTIGRDPPLHLEPVAVRRDSSARWAAGTDQGAADPFAWSPEDAENPTAGIASGAEVEPFDESSGDPELELEAGQDQVAPSGPADDRDEGERAPLRGDVGTPAEESAEPGHDVDRGTSEGAGSTMPPPRPDTPSSATRSIPAATRQAVLFAEYDLRDPGAAAVSGEPLFRVQCLGPFRVWARGEPVERWPLEKSRELLALLIAHGGASVAREVVAEALWQDYDWDASLKHTLSNTATTLRSTLRTVAGDTELQPLVAARQRFQLPSAIFGVDLDAFDAAVGHAGGLPDPEALDEYERVLGLYTGEFMEGEFFTWLDPYRMDYRQRLIDAARRAAAIAEGLGQSARAALFHRVIFEREPTDEDAARGVMRCLADANDIVGVRKTFKTLAEALVSELDDPGARPAAETRALLTELVGATANG
jgi:DNA-binding SARP family transcriptional activator